MTEPAVDVAAPVSSPPRLSRFIDHLEAFAEATARRARRWLTPLRVFAATVLLAAFLSAWRLSSWDGSTSLLAFVAWILPLSLPAGLLFAFFMVFRVIAELPAQLAGLRGSLAALAEPTRQHLDQLMDRSERGWLGLGRVVTIGRMMLELRHLGGMADMLPQGMGMAPLMANPLFWILFLFTSLVGMGTIALAILLLLLS
jgi:hypothetical protein